MDTYLVKWSLKYAKILSEVVAQKMGAEIRIKTLEIVVAESGAVSKENDSWGYYGRQRETILALLAFDSLPHRMEAFSHSTF